MEIKRKLLIRLTPLEDDLVSCYAAAGIAAGRPRQDLTASAMIRRAVREYYGSRVDLATGYVDLDDPDDPADVGPRTTVARVRRAK